MRGLVISDDLFRLLPVYRWCVERTEFVRRPLFVLFLESFMSHERVPWAGFLRVAVPLNGEHESINCRQDGRGWFPFPPVKRNTLPPSKELRAGGGPGLLP